MLPSIIVSMQIIPTYLNFEKAKRDLLFLIEESRVGNDLTLIAGSVRLAFHDCVGIGHCNGCIDHSNPDNAGLRYITNPIDSLYDLNYKGKMSRADFYALAAVVALTRSTRDAPVKYVGLKNFKVGRRDCDQSPIEPRGANLPKATDGTTKTFKFFKNEFGFNEREAVVLMGAHTLGRCTLQNSGFQGSWVGERYSTVKQGLNTLAPTSTLDNAYYNEIIDEVDWMQVQLQSKKKQWQEPKNPIPNDKLPLGLQGTLLLNSDMALSWNIEPKDDFGTVSCLASKWKTPLTCKHSSAHKHAAEFSHNNTLWVQEFTAVFNRMIEKNDNQLKEAPTMAYKISVDEIEKLLEEKFD